MKVNLDKVKNMDWVNYLDLMISYHTKDNFTIIKNMAEEHFIIRKKFIKGNFSKADFKAKVNYNLGMEIFIKVISRTTKNMEKESLSW